MTASSLLLLHGLGATAGVWAEVIDRLDWPGRVMAPDLPGHGSAPWTDDYTIGALAAGVSPACEAGEEVVVVGHSMGGAVGLCLASGFFRPVARSVIGIGIKVTWSDEEVAGIAKVAAKGVRWADSREEAVERFLRGAGLVGLVDGDHEAVNDAVVEDQGRWRVAQDPATFAQTALDMRGLMDGARCPVILGAGENDPMVNSSDLSTYVHEPRLAPGRGHNVHVEDPDWVVSLIKELEPH